MKPLANPPASEAASAWAWQAPEKKASKQPTTGKTARTAGTARMRMKSSG
jgi:hypothetical protein